MPVHVQVMAWSRGYEEDRRFRKSLASSMLGVAVLILLVGSIAIPIVERQTIDELPERVAKLVRDNLPPPPPPAPVEEPRIEEDIHRNLPVLLLPDQFEPEQIHENHSRVIRCSHAAEK